ncbi:MAG: YabP/YqfC family sporulation protein [Lachnospiraceae bacterium]|nr:YabP/YqfC family sporulation protein [Lachnospiraceae bacterium]
MFRKEQKKEQHDGFKIAGLARTLQIPEDFTRGNILVTMQGQERIIIENFKGISLYTEEEIRLITKRKKICITGKKLMVESYTKEEIEITGLIDKLEYL